jgi:hypothetical protein
VRCARSCLAAEKSQPKFQNAFVIACAIAGRTIAPEQ